MLSSISGVSVNFIISAIISNRRKKCMSFLNLFYEVLNCSCRSSRTIDARSINQFVNPLTATVRQPAINCFQNGACIRGTGWCTTSSLSPVYGGPARTLPSKKALLSGSPFYTYALSLQIENQYFFLMISMVLL